MNTEQTIGLVVKDQAESLDPDEPTCFLMQLTEKEFAAWMAVTTHINALSETEASALASATKALSTLSFSTSFIAVGQVNDAALAEVFHAIKAQDSGALILASAFVTRLLNDVDLDVVETELEHAVVHIQDKAIRLTCVDKHTDTAYMSELFPFQSLHDAFARETS